MIESTLIQEIVEETERAAYIKLIVRILRRKFGEVGAAIEAGLALVKEEERLMLLGELASDCASLQTFETALREELPKPPPASPRGKRRKKAE